MSYTLTIQFAKYKRACGYPMQCICYRPHAHTAQNLASHGSRQLTIRVQGQIRINLPNLLGSSKLHNHVHTSTTHTQHSDACAEAAVSKPPANKQSAKDVIATSAQIVAVLISMPSCHRSVLHVYGCVLCFTPSGKSFPSHHTI